MNEAGFIVKALNDETLDDWRMFVGTHPGATLYHTPEWLGLMDAVFGYRQHGLVQYRGGRVVGGVPLYTVPNLLGVRLTTSPFRDRGGLLMAPGQSPAPLLDMAGRLARERRATLLLKQGDPLEGAGEAGFKAMEYWVTTRVDLREGGDALWRRLGNNAQGPVRQAERLGVRVRVGESERDVESFVAVFARTRRQLGIPTFPKRFFPALMTALTPGGYARLLLAEAEGRVIAGLLMLIFGDTAIDGYAASLPEFRESRPNDLLVWKAIVLAAEHGCSVFDFGADSPAQKGLLAFKRKWGGTHRTLVHYGYPTALPPMDSSGASYDLARRVVRGLPMSFFHATSEAVVRYLA